MEKTAGSAESNDGLSGTRSSVTVRRYSHEKGRREATTIELIPDDGHKDGEIVYVDGEYFRYLKCRRQRPAMFISIAFGPICVARQVQRHVGKKIASAQFQPMPRELIGFRHLRVVLSRKQRSEGVPYHNGFVSPLPAARD